MVNSIALKFFDWIKETSPTEYGDSYDEAGNLHLCNGPQVVV